jgi:hypothetical protein
MLKGIVRNFYCAHYIPDMFRHSNAILRGLLVPSKLLQFSLGFGWMWAIVRLVLPSAAECVPVCMGRIWMLKHVGDLMNTIKDA